MTSWVHGGGRFQVLKNARISPRGKWGGVQKHRVVYGSLEPTQSKSRPQYGGNPCCIGASAGNGWASPAPPFSLIYTASY